MFNILN